MRQWQNRAVIGQGLEIGEVKTSTSCATRKAAINVADTTREIANAWKKDHPEMSGQEAADRALVLMNKVTRTIHEHKITGDVGTWLGTLGVAIGNAMANKKGREE